jgi:hypothetical protein
MFDELNHVGLGKKRKTAKKSKTVAKKSMKCFNGNATFTGKEKTPLGRGYSAKFFKKDHVMEGKDGKKYVVICVKRAGDTKSYKKWSLIKKAKTTTHHATKTHKKKRTVIRTLLFNRW